MFVIFDFNTPASRETWHCSYTVHCNSNFDWINLVCKLPAPLELVQLLSLLMCICPKYVSLNAMQMIWLVLSILLERKICYLLELELKGSFAPGLNSCTEKMFRSKATKWNFHLLCIEILSCPLPHLPPHNIWLRQQSCICGTKKKYNLAIVQWIKNYWKVGPKYILFKFLVSDFTTAGYNWPDLIYSAVLYPVIESLHIDKNNPSAQMLASGANV